MLLFLIFQGPCCEALADQGPPDILQLICGLKSNAFVADVDDVGR